ncbi:arsenical pump-driving ATPase [Jeotgalibacillus campisalis]|uniref:Arsenic transporter ATPase n=1 Tax=Jeotgalibacillus campisalis TaxID=220754 RepID=A0A0C2SFT9_9BACL|nr:arsenical pump-driving ATPase [Jeotgalibacillus campisalis]KIL52794.1 arsenic transporter ATPase [Jeotgalibacillus campisalis]
MFERFNPSPEALTPFLFFTGKGGVGKTSTACATAISLADQGKNVLLVSTDPASNLQDVLEFNVQRDPKAVPAVEGLYACNIDPEEAARMYREKMVGPYRGVLPDDAVASMEEQLSGACTVEIAAFDEFTTLLVDTSVTSQYDHILFDTAPTGHTLRLLQLPTAWSSYLTSSTHGASCLGPLSGLQEKKTAYSESMKALSDPEKTQLMLVTRPESSAIAEAQRAANELLEIGMVNQHLIINGWLEALKTDDAVAKAFYNRQQDAVSKIDENSSKSISILPFVSHSLTGIESLRTWFSLQQEELGLQNETPSLPAPVHSIDDYVDSLIAKNQRVIMTMGKGGVGKTSMAASIAAKLSEKGHSVHLTTTDPADHLSGVVANAANLHVSSIDPKKEVERYTNQVLTEAAELSDSEREYLEEDLRSPCTEEIAVFQAFASIVAQSVHDFVVIDTAPTGHTLLLLDAAQSYHKEVERMNGQKTPDSIKQLLPTLRDPLQTSIAIVTLAEATPVLEASRLQEDLKRARIVPSWWLINQSLFAADSKEPVLANRATEEIKWIDTVQRKLANETVLIPWHI